MKNRGASRRGRQGAGSGLAPNIRRWYVAAYIPWAGDMGRRWIPTAGVYRVTWLQLVVDVVMDGHDPAALDARYGWPHGRRFQGGAEAVRYHVIPGHRSPKGRRVM